MKHSGSPIKDPNVPGANGMFPTQKPVARHTTACSLKFMARVYNPVQLLSSYMIAILKLTLNKIPGSIKAPKVMSPLMPEKQ